ncbi:hypothetical protein BT69DRAFT_801387 [Atractiella rhizophila]|nr:hypothetical protein BT69DRAFT_801387 [Atractiella rhizophila]
MYVVDVKHCPNFFLERLFLSSLILATKYDKDDAYTNKSFKIAASHLFTVQEINENEMELLRCLDYKLRGKEEDLNTLLAKEEELWLGSLERKRRKLRPSSWGLGLIPHSI